MISILTLAVTLLVSSADAGVSYVRWGRTVCPEEAVLLYKGYMAGSHHNEGGNGANYLCLHEHPQFVRQEPGVQQWAARIFGVELKPIHQPGRANMFSAENLHGGSVNDQDLPCAVCHVLDASDQLMVPGRQDCGGVGYDLQYKGILVAEAHVGRHRGNYVCLDEAPEGRSGGSGNEGQSVVYPVQSGCGSLPCGPYIEGLEISCSVCTH